MLFKQITNGRFETPPNYLSSRLLIVGSYTEVHFTSGTLEQRTNTCNDNRQNALLLQRKHVHCGPSQGPDPRPGASRCLDLDQNWNPNSHFDFNQDLKADHDSDPDFFLDSHPNSVPDKVCDPD